MKYAIIGMLFGSVLASAATQTLQERSKPYLNAARAAGFAFVSVSAASGMPNLAPDSLRDEPEQVSGMMVNTDYRRDATQPPSRQVSTASQCSPSARAPSFAL